MDQTRTGALIRTLRQQKHLTQRQLADTIGVSDKAVSKWERGCGAPDISLLPDCHRLWARAPRRCSGAIWRKTICQTET